MKLFAFTDGASRGNPGHAGIGVLVKNEEGIVVIEEKRYIGKTTNNVAEYTALITCLQALQNIERRRATDERPTIIFHSDSELMVKQMTGAYKIKNDALRNCAGQARDMLSSLKADWTLKYIPRELNKETDRLANKAIDEAVE
jgi:ribonuclease HI